MSDQETTDNFFQVWAQWDRREPPPVFFRLYYDDRGEPLFYSMEDLPGNYIEVDQETYALQSYKVRVVDGQLKKLNNKPNVSKLRPGATGTPCDPRDVCVIVSPTQPCTRWTKTYES